MGYTAERIGWILPSQMSRLASHASRVVGEVRRDDALQLHPEVAVVVLDHEAAGGGAGDDRAAAGGDEHRGAEGLAAGVLEHDVEVVAD